ncbi:MAG: PIN domain-containing protein [Blastocatellia bacterium]|nr:PIN domain-containing protein [Blastocatellia bacterium]MDW8064318.1 PIN domain-containing protein [Anaerolineae bacterium]
MNQESEATRPIFIFDTSVLIDYLRDQGLAADAFAQASKMGEVWLTIISLLELYLPSIRKEKKKEMIGRDIQKVEKLEKAYGARVMPIPEDAQRHAVNVIARHHYDTLGKGLLGDSLILACGFLENAWLVTRDEKWFQLVHEQRNPLRLRVIGPTRLVQATTLDDLLK